MGHGGRLPVQPSGRGKHRSLVHPRRALSFLAPPALRPSPLDSKKIARNLKQACVKSKLVSDKRLSCCAVESSMSKIRARRARQLHQIASLVGLTEKFRPAAR